ncbi:sigma-70 family RNA polymerase sigma factor [Nocardia sp. NBC_00565]|uniref:sigma-70 family RNA polymerase sigma factor n=1 Tax=Nocardia sp. NBC_00565 TaxID=2975993 RepID=UPI002E800343|nr:sigma-70 family RNA polymerase sigma factor [Nocardia sp. NBC_00565]WUB99968.1 sigma-70 family RNA polymerase sigma factor [Nocardia sp. NBC_00565]
MDEHDFLAGRFVAHRAHLIAVAYRMLGSLSEAEDAVQEAWLRLSRVDTAEIDNLGGWLTTTVGRVCLDMLRSRKMRREEVFEAHLPDPIVTTEDGTQPEQQAVLADSVGLALLVVLDSLNPAERVTFVLHDMFAVPFDQIGPIIGKSAAAAKMMASRARRRVQGRTPRPDRDLPRQRRVVDAFLAAARGGEFEALLAILDPDVVLRADAGALLPGGMQVLHGAAAVAGRLDTFRRAANATVSQPVLINGLAGLLNTIDGRTVSLLAFTIVDNKIAAIDLLSDPARLPQNAPAP